MHKERADILYEQYQDLWAEIKSEVTKASQIMWFVGIILFIALGKIAAYGIGYKMVMAVLLVIALGILLRTILGAGYLWHTTEAEFVQDDYLHILQTRYDEAKAIWSRKHRLNHYNVLMALVILCYTLGLLFFVQVGG